MMKLKTLSAGSSWSNSLVTHRKKIGVKATNWPSPVCSSVLAPWSSNLVGLHFPQSASATIPKSAHWSLWASESIPQHPPSVSIHNIHSSFTRLSLAVPSPRSLSSPWSFCENVPTASSIDCPGGPWMPQVPFVSLLLGCTCHSCLEH